MPPSGEPRESPKPQPIGNYPLIALFTICTLCALFLIWRRANSLRSVVAHQLKTWTTTEGRIRLSEDDGPPARSFVDNHDEESEDEEDAEPLAARVERLKSQQRGGTTSPPGNGDALSPFAKSFGTGIGVTPTTKDGSSTVRPGSGGDPLTRYL